MTARLRHPAGTAQPVARTTAPSRLRPLLALATAALTLVPTGQAVASTALGAAPVATTLASDSLNRHVTRGWGTATSGERWAVSSVAATAVNGSRGVLRVAPGRAVSAELQSAGVLGTDTVVSFSLASLPRRGNGAWFAVASRQAGGEVYRQRVRISPGGRLQLSVIRVERGSDDETTVGRPVTLPATVRAGQVLNLRARTTGTRTVLLTSKVWVRGSREPGWQSSVADSSARRVDTAGRVALWAYTSGSSTTTLTQVDAVSVTRVTESAITPRRKPAPAPAPTASSPSVTTTATTPAPTTTTTTAPSTPAPAASTTAATQPSVAPAPSPSTTDAPAPITTPTAVPAPSASTEPTPTTTSAAPAPSTTTAAPAPSTAAPVPSTTVTAPPAPPNLAVRPDGSSTGVRAGTVLSDVWGDLTITTPGTVVEGRDIHGFVSVRAANVTIRNSVIRGGDAGTVQRALVSSTQPGFVIEDSELSPAFPSVNLDGLKGYGFTARRLNIHDAVDNAVIYGSDTTIESSWLHDNRHYLVDPRQGFGPSHDDGVQVEGGTNVVLRANSITGGYNAALMVTQNYAVTADMDVRGNWFGGGGCSVNVSQKSRGPIVGLGFTGNRFDRTSKYNCPLIINATIPATYVDNTYTGSTELIRINLN